ncbi:hypothetical protein [Streptomyces sp. NPDC001315]|uniref:hypothetical protein n=1 Tax=Streptomyces sp. NPDC001315 TaxID=3364562 RepID=UPI0036BD2EB9
MHRRPRRVVRLGQQGASRRGPHRGAVLGRHDWAGKAYDLLRGTDHLGLWADVEPGEVELFVAPSRRAPGRAFRSADDFTAECARRGVRLETAGLAEPVFGAGAQALTRRRLSTPTAGYDGC